MHKLKGKIDDIELVLFEADKTGNIPRLKELRELKKVSIESGLTYTAHLPLDINLGSSISGQREKSIECARTLIECLSFINPYAYILHLNLTADAQKNLKSWQERVSDSLKRIVNGRRKIVKNIAIENSSYPFRHVDRLITGDGFAVCTDIGYLITLGIDPLEHCRKYFKAMRLVHLHGVNGSKDHVSLKYLESELLKRVIRFLREKDYRGVLTLEVFSQTDLEESMDILWCSLD